MPSPARIRKWTRHLEEKSDLAVVTSLRFRKRRVDVRCRALELIEHALETDRADRRTARVQEHRNGAAVRRLRGCSAEILE